LSTSRRRAWLALALLAGAHCAAAQQLPPLDGTTSLLVVAPHPDDETLCCAGVIQRVAQAGGRIAIVWITSGDASELDLLMIERRVWPAAGALRELGARRMAEARRASARLGVPAAGQLFLGYPDRGVLRLLTDHRDAPYTSSFTGTAAVPYPAALYPGHPYTGASLARDFAAVLARVQPTLILAPSPRDEHPDHRAAGLLMRQTDTHGAQVRYWIVHGGEGWPSPRELMPGVPLSAAPRSQGLALAAFELTPAEEDRMLEALRAYDTQLRTIAPFLLSFVRSTELFSAVPGG
jgi:LmbE family N-acetylglucosaminyl deacetylase